MVNSHLMCEYDPTIRQPGFDLPRHYWSLNRFRTEQGHCGACRRKWRLTDTDLCPCGETHADDVSHCRILAVPSQNWVATYLRMKTLFRGDQLWFMTRIREEEDVPADPDLWDFDLLTLTVVCESHLKVTGGETPSKFGHDVSLCTRRTDGQTKATLIAPIFTVGGIMVFRVCRVRFQTYLVHTKEIFLNSLVHTHKPISPWGLYNNCKAARCFHSCR